MIEQIAREDDPRLEPYRHVGDPRWLRDRDLFVAEGRLVVTRLYAAGHHVESLLVTPAAWAALAPIVGEAPAIYVAPQALVNGITGFNFHRGCLAMARRLPARTLDEFAGARRLVILEGIGDPDNVGGIFRSAAALGGDGVLLAPGSADPLYRKAVRTSVGATLTLPFGTIEGWPVEAFDTLRRMGFTIAALSPAGSATLDEFAATMSAHRIALIAGAEGPGLTPAALDAADRTVRIPIEAAADSLNVVVAVSIALQRLRR